MALPRKAFLWPVLFAADNPVIRVDTGTAQEVVLAVSAAELHWMSGDDSTTTNLKDLLKALEDALNTNTDGRVATVTMDPATHIVTVAWNVASSILWSHANTTVDPTIFGWTSGDVGPSASLVAPNQTKGVWLPEQEVADDTEDPELIGATVITSGTASRGSHHGAVYSRRIFYSLISDARIHTDQADATKPYGAFEYSWVDGRIGSGAKVRIYDDTTSRTTTSYKGYVHPRRDVPWRAMDLTLPDKFELELNLLRVEVPT